MASLFSLPNVGPSQDVRIDTASGSDSAATITFMDGTAIPGAKLKADKDGALPAIYGPAGVNTLYLKRLTYHGDVSGSPVTLTGSNQAAPSSPGASSAAAIGRWCGYLDIVDLTAPPETGEFSFSGTPIADEGSVVTAPATGGTGFAIDADGGSYTIGLSLIAFELVGTGQVSVSIAWFGDDNQLSLSDGCSAQLVKEASGGVDFLTMQNTSSEVKLPAGTTFFVTVNVGGSAWTAGSAQVLLTVTKVANPATP